MAAAGAPAARCLTVLHLLVLILGQPGQALGLQKSAAEAVNLPSYEELTSSLLINQLAILQQIGDASGAAAESCTHEAAARDARLKETLEAGQQRCSQKTLEALRATQDTITASGRAEVTAVRKEVTALRQQMDKLLEELHKSTAPACPLGWVRRQSSCYLIDETGKRTWEASRGYCRSFGGDLVKITSAGENQFIRGQLGDSVWIGLNDRTTEGRFVWSDSSQPTYTGWTRGEPNGGRGESCVEMRKAHHYSWNDKNCNSQFGAVCEKAVGA